MNIRTQGLLYGLGSALLLGGFWIALIWLVPKVVLTYAGIGVAIASGASIWHSIAHREKEYWHSVKPDMRMSEQRPAELAPAQPET